MKGREQVEAEVRELVAEALGGDMEPGQIPSDVPIFQGGLGMDSMSGVELMTALEERFDLYIEDDQFGIFDSLDQMVEFVVENQGGGSP